MASLVLFIKVMAKYWLYSIMNYSLMIAIMEKSLI